MAGWTGWARSHFFNVWWKRSTFPQVCGWFGDEFYFTTPGWWSWFSNPLRPPLPPENRVV